MERRKFLQNSVLAAGALLINEQNILGKNLSDFVVADEFTLPKLPYAMNALEPIIDQKTMEIHHGKHHNAYVTNLNKALANLPKTWNSVSDICRDKKLMKVDAIRNNAGGHYNHSLFWELMQPSPNGMPSANLAAAINASFGSLEKMKEQFNDTALKRFGSGWVWLVKDKSGKLVIGSTANQDNPLMKVSPIQGKPIIALDVWEHAYYIKYQNKRKDYVEAWWSVVNWVKVSELFEQ